MSMDLPFEPSPAEPMVDSNEANYSGGVVVLASYVDTPVGRSASLVFRFSDPNGRFYPPVVLVLDDRQMAGIGGLVTQAAERAFEATRGKS